MTFIDAFFAFFIATTGVPGGCDGPLADNPSVQSVCARAEAASESDAKGHGKKDADGDDEDGDDVIWGRKLPKKISNGF